jgi:hypothetical protein
MKYLKKLVRAYLCWSYSEKRAEKLAILQEAQLRKLSTLKNLLKDVSEMLPSEDVIEGATKKTKEACAVAREAAASAGEDEWGLGKVWTACFNYGWQKAVEDSSKN